LSTTIVDIANNILKQICKLFSDKKFDVIKLRIALDESDYEIFKYFGVEYLN